MKNRSSFLLFLFLFALPLGVVIVYELIYATDRFPSSTSIVITEEQGTQSTIDL